MPSFAFVNTYAGNPLDRASDRRGDGDWLQARQSAAGALAIAFWKGDPLVVEHGEAASLATLPAPLAAQLADARQGLLFLGLRNREGEDEQAVFACQIESAADPSAGPLQGLGRFIGLRQATPILSGEDAAMAATARAVFEWRRRHRHCAVCGQPTQSADAGWKLHCPACGADHFPRTDPVVIMLPFRGERCLLGRQASWDRGRFSCLAGFLEPGESIEEACAREVREECGLVVEDVSYHSSQPWPYPSNLMIGLMAQVAEGEAAPDQTELEAVRWFSREEARSLLAGEIDGLSAPPPLAIAHHLLRAWACS